jgi:hypothetical protein
MQSHLAPVIHSGFHGGSGDGDAGGETHRENPAGVFVQK